MIHILQESWVSIRTILMMGRLNLFGESRTYAAFIVGPKQIKL